MELHAPTIQPQGKGLQDPGDERLGGAQSWSGHHREEKNLLPMKVIKSLFFGLLPYQLSYHNFIQFTCSASNVLT
jgi:hypothetical protein